jgi:putative radical SAM enzyme (TIGR03279 family)
MKIVAVKPDSIASELGILPGDELLELNDRKVHDHIDVRFHEEDPFLTLKIARDGETTTYEVENDEGEKLGLDFEEMKILSCGNDCIFCFVDQNPAGLRKQLYFRDGDYRLSFLYGNYTTLTNAGPAILQRIVDQRLSPQYISVHVTDFTVRRRLMGLKKDDRIMEKIRFLHDNGIAMHTQIVLCPGINDGDVLEKTVEDLYAFRKQIISLALVPVGLTDHRFGLTALTKVDGEYAARLLSTVDRWQKRFRRESRRGFIYPSDEFYIVAGRNLPSARSYDGFPQVENGVGLVRSFLEDLRRQSGSFPRRLKAKRRLTLVTAELPSGIIAENLVHLLNRISGLDCRLEILPNTLYGRSVTVAGLLSGKCLYSRLEGNDNGDGILLPPDILNADGLFLDGETLPRVQERLGVPVRVFDGRWDEIFRWINLRGRNTGNRDLVPSTVPASMLIQTQKT